MENDAFAAGDQRPLRSILQGRPSADAEPEAGERAEPSTTRVDEVELPVAVQDRDQPDGVPLQRILTAAKAASTSVTGLAVRGGTLLVLHDRVPTAKEQRRLRTLLGDPEKLDQLREPPPAVGAEAGDLERVLLDEATPDAEWIRAFRRYAVERIIPAREDG
jgi:hypothetical protein